MKLGKKALSCLLAIIMIVTSVSVCFTVLGADATTQASSLFNTITQVYDDLKNGWDLAHAAEPDTSRVPTQDAGTVWKVEVDGYHSGWMQTAKAFYNYVKVRCNGENRTYAQAVDDAINYMRNSNGLSATSNPSLTDVTNFLSYFKFNGTTAPVTLNIGTGYDILAWAPDINAIEIGRTYYTSTVHFDTSGGNINPAGCTWSETVVTDPEANDQLTIANIKQALQDCVKQEAFKTWFNLDFDNMEVNEIMALVQGETSCANTLAAFSLVANLSGSASDAELWDAYVAPQVGKTWEETNDWVQNGLMGAIYKAYAADYTEQLNTIMAEDTSAYTGAQKRDYYNRFVQICLNLENQQDYQFNNIFELILPHMADGFYNKADGLGSIHSDLWVSSASTVGAALATAKKNVAKKFAEEYADAFMELVDREVPSYDRSSETQAAAWLNNASTGNAWDGVDDSQYHEGDYLDTNGNGIPDKQDAEAFVTAATAMIANVDGDILPYGTFNDISTSFGTVPNPNHNNSLNTITEDGYNTLLAKIKSAQISANGASAFLGKAQTDAFMKSTILKGQTQENLQNIYTDYYALYATIKATKDAGGELYALVFGNGWKTDGTDEENNTFNTASLAAADEAFQAYSDYDHLIKTTAIDRLYTKLDTIVNKYYGSSGARYYTFEAIIEAYGNLEITPANLFNWLYGTGVRYEAQAGEHTQSELQTLYNSATSAYNSANTFKTNLRQLITARGSGTGADIEIQKYLFGVGGIASQTYGWRTSVSAIKVENITAAVNSVGLKNYSNATDANIRTLLNNAVTDLDAILVSDDVGSILDELVTVDVKDDQGNIVYEADGVTPKKQGLLGKWKQAYTFLDTSTRQNKTVAVGDDIKNLREFLINLIVDMLYNGKLLNTLFELIYPAIGGMITDGVWTNADPIDISVAYIYMQGLSGILRRGLPVSPHLFGTRDVGDGDVKWSYFYDGNHLPYNYSNVITAMNTATRFADKAACWSAALLGKHNQDVSFWTKTGRTAQQTSRSGLYSGGTMVDPFTVNQSDVVDWTAMETNPQNTWKLDARNPQTLYYALAAMFGPLGAVLRTALTGASSNVESNVGVGSNRLDVNLRLSGDNLYTRLFEPLYWLLGINNYASRSQIESDTETEQAFGQCYVIKSSKGYGRDLWQHIFEPLIQWMEGTLFVKPVATILDILPNLLAMLDDNQLVPKLKNISIIFKVLSFDVYTLKLGDVLDIEALLRDKVGIDLSTGIDGVLQGLIGCTAKTNVSEVPIGDDDHKSLMKYNKETGEVLETEVASYKKGNTTYYFTDCGLLTQTLYNLLGDGLMDWLYSKTNTGAANNIANNKKSAVPLSLPVNRLLAAGSVTSKALEDGYTHWKIATQPGVVLLEVLRWIADDGTWYKILPLLSGLISSEPDPETGEEPTDIMGMVGRILDGNADNVMAILIDLLNEYKVTTKTYTDTIATNYQNFQRKDPSEVLLEVVTAGSKWRSKFQLGEYLDTILADNGVSRNGNDTFDKKMAKANKATESLDKIINGLVPLIGQILSNIEALKPIIEKYGLTEIVDRIISGDLDNLEDAVSEILCSNELIDILMDLLFGSHVPTTDEETGETNDNVGILSKLIADTDILGRVVNLTRRIDLDISPKGFYNAATGAGPAAATNVRSASIAQWISGQATKLGKSIDDLSWAEMSFNRATDDIDWLGITNQTGIARYNKLKGFLEAFLQPLAPILNLILTNEPITLADKLTIRGGFGYSEAIVPIFEAFGLKDTSACVYQFQFNNSVYTTNSFTAANLETINWNSLKGNNRFVPMANSPLDALLTGIGQVLYGENNLKGLLKNPITVLGSVLPNLAYFMYKQNGSDEANNLAVAVQNLIAPVLQLLKIVDPVLERIIALDIEGLLNQYLDLETLLNELLSRLISGAKENAYSTYRETLDFAALAADGSTYAELLPTKRYHATSNTNVKFTYFTAAPGQLLITLLRQVLSPDLVIFLGDTIMNIFTEMGVQTAYDVESNQRIQGIITNIVNNLNTLAKAADGADHDYSAKRVDILTGLIIDLLTEYSPDGSEYYFYEYMNKVDSEITTTMQSDAWNEYYIENNGYDWDGVAEDEDGDKLFTKTDVENAISNLDYVIQKALPDVLSALFDEGMISLDFLTGVEDYANGSGLWALLKGLLSTNVLTDDFINMVANGLFGLIGGASGTLDAVLNILTSAGINFTATNFYQIATGTGLVSYMKYGFDANSIDADAGTAKINGETVDFDWAQIIENHYKDGEGNINWKYETYEDSDLLIPGPDGKPVKLSEKEKDDEGNEIDKKEYNEETGTYEIVYAKSLTASEYPFVKDGNKYVYTYTDAEGNEQEYKSDYNFLKAFIILKDEDGEETGDPIICPTEAQLEGKYNEYKLTVKVNKEATPYWSWNLDSITSGTSEEQFLVKKDRFLHDIWVMISPLEDVFAALFAGKDLKLFKDETTGEGALNIKGVDGYANVFVPLFNALGLEQILNYANTNPADTANPSETILQYVNRVSGRTGDQQIKPDLLTAAEYQQMLAEDGMEACIDYIANDVLGFVEIVTTFPIATLTQALPTLAYFLYADGLTTLVQNLLIPITTLTNIIGWNIPGSEDPVAGILTLKIDEILAAVLEGVISMMRGDEQVSWEAIQNLLQSKVEYNEETGEIETHYVTGFKPNFTQTIFRLLGSLEFDLSGILKPKDAPEDDTTDYSHSLVFFLDKDAEAEAKAKLAAAAEADAAQAATLKDEAAALRADALRAFIKSIAAIGDSYDDLGETAPVSSVAGYTGNVNDLVKIDSKGQVTVSKAEVLMFLVTFIKKNTTIMEMIGNLLGKDITDENYEDDVLDEVLTNVFNNPEALVDLIVDLLTGYKVKGGAEIVLADVESETHYEFYEDAGYNTLEEVLAENKRVLEENPDATKDDLVSEISRVKTSAAIDNLDNLVGTILNLFKDQLLAVDDPATEADETGLLIKLGLTPDTDLTLKNIVSKLITSKLLSDDMLNDLVSMLINTLGTGSATNIINVIVKVLDGAGYSFTPQTVKGNVSQLSGIIGSHKKWNEVAADNLEFVYEYVTGTDDNGEETTAKVYSATEGLTSALIDLATGKITEDTTVGVEKALRPVMVMEDQIDPDTGEVVKDEEGNPVQVATDEQQQTVRIHVEWGLNGVTDAREGLDTLVNLVWSLIKPLHGVFELLFTGNHLTIYDKIKIEGLEGYQTVILPLLQALAIDKLYKADPSKIYTDSDELYLAEGLTKPEDFMKAVYGETATITEDPTTHIYKLTEDSDESDNNYKLILDTLIDAIWALVESLCDRPVNTLLIILPHLARFLISNGADKVIENLLAPVTTITDKIKAIYSIDIMGMLKDMLKGIVENANKEDDEDEDAPVAPGGNGSAGAMFAQYLLDKIEDVETPDQPDNSELVQEIFEPLIEDEDAPAAPKPNMAPRKAPGDASNDNTTILDILMQLIDSVSITISKDEETGTETKLVLSDILPDTIFIDLASCAWLFAHHSMKEFAEFAADRRSGTLKRDPVTEAESYVVDRETVLLEVLNWIVFNDGIRDVAVNLLKINYENLGVDEELGDHFDLDDPKTDYLLAVLVYSIFNDAEPVERLLIDLLSWYEIEYQPARVQSEYPELEAEIAAEAGIDYEAAGIKKDELEVLPSQIDTLVAGIIPAVIDLLPEGTLGGLTISGSNTQEMVENLLVGLMKDSTVDGEFKAGLATKLVGLLVNAIGGNETITNVIGMLPEIVDGLDLTLKHFMDSSEAFQTYFAPFDKDSDGKVTWAEAYDGLKTEKIYEDNTIREAGDNEKATTEGNVTTITAKDNADDVHYVITVSGSANDQTVVTVDGESEFVSKTRTVKADGYGWLYTYNAEDEITGVTAYVLDDNKIVKTEKDGDDYKIVYEQKLDENNKPMFDADDNPIYDTTKPVYEYEINLTNTNSFGIETYDNVLDLISQILTPLVPVLRMLLTEQDLIILDGIHITAGDGYDRFIVPVFEALGIPNIIDKVAFKALDDTAYARQILTYVDALINKIVASPVQTIVGALPQLVWFVYSDGLAQGIEQFVAPLITLVDLVNDVTGAKVTIPDANVNAEGTKEYAALDIYAIILGFIKGNDTLKDLIPNIDNIKNIYDLVDNLLTCESLEKLLKKLLDDKGIDLGEIPVIGLFKYIIVKTCHIEDVETVRYYQATVDGERRTVKGVVSNMADTLMAIVGDTILGGDLVESLVEQITGEELSDTVKQILAAITHENRYVIFKILLKYFNEYDVENMLLEYLSFDRLTYDYDTYIDGSEVGIGDKQRKVRRAIKKLDKTLLAAIPELLPVLKENETFKAILKNIPDGASLKDAVDAILQQYVIKDEIVNTVMSLLIGLLADNGDTIDGIAPLVDQIVGLDIAPAAFAEASGEPFKTFLSGRIDAALALNPTDDEGEARTAEDVSWSEILTPADYAPHFVYAAQEVIYKI